jgi:hypothetical protein
LRPPETTCQRTVHTLQCRPHLPKAKVTVGGPVRSLLGGMRRHLRAHGNIMMHPTTGATAREAMRRPATGVATGGGATPPPTTWGAMRRPTTEGAALLQTMEEATRHQTTEAATHHRQTTAMRSPTTGGAIRRTRIKSKGRAVGGDPTVEKIRTAHFRLVSASSLPLPLLDIHTLSISSSLFCCRVCSSPGRSLLQYLNSAATYLKAATNKIKLYHPRPNLECHIILYIIYGISTDTVLPMHCFLLWPLQ